MNSAEQAVRAMVQGSMLGSVMAMQREGGPLMIVDIRQGADDDGAYLPYFDVILFSGAVIRVTVSTMADVARSVTDEVLAEERVLDIRNRLRADMTRTIGVWTSTEDAQVRGVIGDLVDDAMHQIEPLLLEGK